MLRRLSNPRYLLPLMMLIGVVILSMRVDDIWELVSSGALIAPVAHAESSAPTSASPAAPAPKDNAKQADKASDSSNNPNGASGSDGSGPLVPPTDEDTSPAEMEVLKQLSARHDELEKRAKALDTREELIKIAEQRVDQKIKELQTLRSQLQSMINQVSESQATQLDNLVKVYETMKPEDAAKILETLDMPVLLNVIQRMKPKSTAPIMAKMTPEKAKDITMALTKQDQLPQVK